MYQCDADNFANLLRGTDRQRVVQDILDRHLLHHIANGQLT